MKIGVTGPHGLLGSELVHQGCSPVESDVTDFKMLQKATQPFDVIIHCAAVTNVDGCETSPATAARVNAGGTYLLTQVFGGKIIYISTDFVFDGEIGPYIEEDRPSPISVYGWSKLGGEIVVNNRAAGDLIIRIATPFGTHPKKQTLVSKIVNRLRMGEPVKFPQELISTPTYIPHLATAIIAAIGKTGILNLSGNRVMPLWEFAREVASLWGFDPALVGNDGPVMGLAPRPLRGGLLVNKAINMGLPITDPLDGLKEMARALESMEAG